MLEFKLLDFKLFELELCQFELSKYKLSETLFQNLKCWNQDCRNLNCPVLNFRSLNCPNLSFRNQNCANLSCRNLNCHVTLKVYNYKKRTKTQIFSCISKTKDQKKIVNKLITLLKKLDKQIYRYLKQSLVINFKNSKLEPTLNQIQKTNYVLKLDDFM